MNFKYIWPWLVAIWVFLNLGPLWGLFACFLAGSFNGDQIRKDNEKDDY